MNRVAVGGLATLLAGMAALWTGIWLLLAGGPDLTSMAQIGVLYQSFLSRLRRGEVGHHHHIAGAYLARYAQESAFREGHRRDDNDAQARAAVSLALKAKSSVDFCGY